MGGLSGEQLPPRQPDLPCLLWMESAENHWYWTEISERLPDLSLALPGRIQVILTHCRCTPGQHIIYGALTGVYHPGLYKRDNNHSPKPVRLIDGKMSISTSYQSEIHTFLNSYRCNHGSIRERVRYCRGVGAGNTWSFAFSWPAWKSVEHQKSSSIACGS